MADYLPESAREFTRNLANKILYDYPELSDPWHVINNAIRMTDQIDRMERYSKRGIKIGRWCDFNLDGSNEPPTITSENEEYYRELYFQLKEMMEQLRFVMVRYYQKEHILAPEDYEEDYDY